MCGCKHVRLHASPERAWISLVKCFKKGTDTLAVQLMMTLNLPYYFTVKTFHSDHLKLRNDELRSKT